MILSVSMIVKNEQTLIARALESVREADEILILDTGSTDHTADVVAALAMPNVRYIAGQYAWNDSFAEARNESLKRCGGEWALVLDADDWMEKDAVPKIRDAIAKTAKRTLRTQMVNASTGGTWRSYCFPKLLKLSAGIELVGEDHEIPNADDGGDPVAVMMIGHSGNHSADPNRSLRILTKSHESNPLNPRTLYYLASEHFARMDYERALVLYYEYLSLSTHRAEKADAYLHVARCHWQRHEGDFARQMCLNAINLNANFREAHLLMADMSFPANSVAWKLFAAAASNADVLFVRA